MNATKTNPLALAAFAELIRRLEKRGHKVTDRGIVGYAVLERWAPEPFDSIYGEIEYCMSLHGWTVQLEAGDYEITYSLTDDKLGARIDRFVARAQSAECH